MPTKPTARSRKVLSPKLPPITQNPPQLRSDAAYQTEFGIVWRAFEMIGTIKGFGWEPSQVQTSTAESQEWALLAPSFHEPQPEDTTETSSEQASPLNRRKAWNEIRTTLAELEREYGVPKRLVEPILQRLEWSRHIQPIYSKLEKYRRSVEDQRTLRRNLLSLAKSRKFIPPLDGEIRGAIQADHDLVMPQLERIAAGIQEAQAVLSDLQKRTRHKKQSRQAHAPKMGSDLAGQLFHLLTRSSKALKDYPTKAAQYVYRLVHTVAPELAPSENSILHQRYRKG